MTVSRVTKLHRRRLMAVRIPEVDYPYVLGGAFIGAVNVGFWVAALHALGVF